MTEGLFHVKDHVKDHAQVQALKLQVLRAAIAAGVVCGAGVNADAVLVSNQFSLCISCEDFDSGEIINATLMQQANGFNWHSTS